MVLIRSNFYKLMHVLLFSGEKLMPNSKYSMEVIQLNDYSLLLNLTIRNLEKRDFGGYNCTSVNALGKAEGSIRLQGKFNNHHVPQ